MRCSHFDNGSRGEWRGGSHGGGNNQFSVGNPPTLLEGMEFLKKKINLKEEKTQFNIGNESHFNKLEF